MAPGGDHIVKKDLNTPLHAHSHQEFKEMLRIIKLLPASDVVKLTKSFEAEWYYMTYHKSDCDKFVVSREMLAGETIKSLMEYFQALFAQKKSKGMLKKQEIDCLHSCMRKHVAHKICSSKLSRKSYHARREEQDHC